MKLSLLFISLLSLSATAQSIEMSPPMEAGMSEERLALIKPHFRGYIDEAKVAGMQTLVHRKGKTVHFESVGYADIDKKTELNDRSLFRIYSMTKPVTSVALMMLFEEGRVQLDDPLSKYIPSFSEMEVMDNEGNISKATNTITILDLLRHTAGLGYGWGSGLVDAKYQKAKLGASKDLEEYVQKVTALPLYFEPQTKWRYSVATTVLGRVIEVISGQTLDQFFSERIFQPLKLANTFFEVPPAKVKNLTTYYKPGDNGDLIIQDNPTNSSYAKNITLFIGGGGLVSSTHDYLRFCRMLLNNGELDGVRLLSRKSIELMTTSHTIGIGFGGGYSYDNQEADGFGLGFAITEGLAGFKNLGSVGMYGWGGAAGTYFRIDPKEEMIIIQMIQLRPYIHLNHRSEFQTLVYQAIID